VGMRTFLIEGEKGLRRAKGSPFANPLMSAWGEGSALGNVAAPQAINASGGEALRFW
jgi:hypothetical protein